MTLPAPSHAETIGLHAPMVAARVRQALYAVPAERLAQAYAAMREGSAARHLDYFFDGRVETIRVFPCPIPILPEQYEYLHQVVRTLHGAVLRLPDLYLGDADVRRILRLEPEEDTWLRECWTPSHGATDHLFDRLDGLVDYSSAVWKETLAFVEPNLTGVGGLHLVPAVEEIVDEAIVPLVAERAPEVALKRLPDARELLLAALERHLVAVGRPGGTICLVEPKYEEEGIDEQRRLVEYFARAHGRVVFHADPKELDLREGEVFLGDARVDLVYRDYSVLDLAELEAEGTDVRAMRRLFRENRVLSSIGAELDHKACWELFTDPVLAERHFTAAECRVFQRHVLWTRLLADRRTVLPGGTEGDLLEYARREREVLVLKPSRGYGGDGVLLGQTVTQSAWEGALDTALADTELWVVQRLGQIPVVEVPTLTTEGALEPAAFYHVMGFASGPEGLAILARASQRQVVNVAQRGGMCAVMLAG
ncbi:MAG: hypothetical protein ACJ8DJ_23130 [Gemmatimonadales bacterium]